MINTILNHEKATTIISDLNKVKQIMNAQKVKGAVDKKDKKRKHDKIISDLNGLKQILLKGAIDKKDNTMTAASKSDDDEVDDAMLEVKEELALRGLTFERNSLAFLVRKFIKCIREEEK